MTTPQETQLIKTFIANKPMVDAVMKILAPDTDEVSKIDRTLDDAEYGRKVKVQTEVRELITVRRAELERIASTNPQTVTENQAR